MGRVYTINGLRRGLSKPIVSLSLVAGLLLAVYGVAQSSLFSSALPAPQTPETVTVIVVASDGLETADATTGPAVPGTDNSPNNGVVKNFDIITYNIETSLNNADDTNLTTTATLNNNASWTAIPDGCKTTDDFPSIAPNSEIRDDNADGLNEILVCNHGDHNEGTKLLIKPAAIASGANLASITATATSTSDNSTSDSIVGLPSVDITASFGISIDKSIVSLAEVDEVDYSPVYEHAQVHGREGKTVNWHIALAYNSASEPVADDGFGTQNFTLTDTWVGTHSTANAAIEGDNANGDYDDGIILKGDVTGNSADSCSLLGQPAASTATVTCSQANPGEPITIQVNGAPVTQKTLAKISLHMFYPYDTVFPSAPYSTAQTYSVDNIVELTGWGGAGTMVTSETGAVDTGPEVSTNDYLISANRPGSLAYQKVFDGSGSQKSGQRAAAPGDVVAATLQITDSRTYDTSPAICDTIDTSVFAFAGHIGAGQLDATQHGFRSTLVIDENQEFLPLHQYHNPVVSYSNLANYLTENYEGDGLSNGIVIEYSDVDYVTTGDDHWSATCEDDLDGDTFSDWTTDYTALTGGAADVVRVRMSWNRDYDAMTSTVDTTPNFFAALFSFNLEVLPGATVGAYAANAAATYDSASPLSNWDDNWSGTNTSIIPYNGSANTGIAYWNVEDNPANALYSFNSLNADRVYIVANSMSIDKELSPADRPPAYPGESVSFIIDPNTSGSAASTATMTITDSMPSGLSYASDDCATVYAGAGLTCLVNVTGQTVTFTIAGHTIGTDLPAFTVTGTVDPDATSGLYRNDASIASDLASLTDDSHCAAAVDTNGNNNASAISRCQAVVTDRHQEYAYFNILNQSGIEVLQTDTLTLSEPTLDYPVTLSYTNLGAEDVGAGQLINVLPYNGDGAVAAIGTGTEFSPERYNGVLSTENPTNPNDGTDTADPEGRIEFVSIAGSSGETFEYSTTAPALIDHRPCHPSNWPNGDVLGGGNASLDAICSAGLINPATNIPSATEAGTGTTVWGAAPGALSDVTAVRASLPAITAGSDQRDLVLTLNTDFAVEGDLYCNNFGLNSEIITLDIISNDVCVEIVDGTISGFVWDDENSNGTSTNSETEPVLAGIPVQLLDNAGAPVLDNDGVAITTTTNASGYYEFTGLPSNEYQVSVTMTEGTQTYDLGGALDNNSATFNVFGPNNPDTGGGLSTADYTDVVDVSQVNFSFSVDPDIEVDKLVEGTDADTTFTDAELIAIPTAGVPTAFQYQITATNASELVAGNGIVLTDYVTDGVTITSVASVSHGSVTTGLPLTAGSTFGATTVEWNLGTLAADTTATLVLNAEVDVTNLTTFMSGALASNRLNQNVVQVTAMTENDADSTVNSHTTTEPSTFTSTGSEDDEDDAFIFVPPTLGDFVWDDVDNDGIQDVGELGINGVTVNLYEDDDGTPGPSVGDTLYATTTTSNNGVADGFYVFGSLTVGQAYWVEFDHASTPALDTYTPTTQGPAVDPVDATDSDGDVTTGYTGLHTMVSGEVRTAVDMGYVSLLSIGDLIFNDFNNNGVYDSATETGINGVDVDLYLDDDGTPGFSGGDTLQASTTTANNGTNDGAYTFTGLNEGDYVIVVADIATDTSINYLSSTGQPTNTSPYEPAADPDDNINNDDNGSTTTLPEVATGTITLAYNTEPTNDGDTNTYTNYATDLGFYVPLSLGNRVFADTDPTTGGDGILNGTEAGIATVNITLLDAGGTPVDDPNTAGLQNYTVTTDASGYYRFDGLSAGDYIVEVDSTTLPAGMVSTPGQTTTNTDSTDHSNDTAVASNYRSHTITLSGDAAAGINPTTETDLSTGNGAEGPSGNAYSNLAIDLGFIYTGDVTISKNANQSIYTLGAADTITYDIDVTNVGPSDAQGIAVVDNEPNSDVTFSWTCTVSTAGTGALTEACNAANGTGSINETVTLNTGGVATYTVTATFANSTTGTITNTATSTLPSYLAQSTTNLTDTDSADVTPQLQTPSITLTKQLYEGFDAGAQCNTAAAVDSLTIVDPVQTPHDLTYCFTISNNGNTHLDSITLSDPSLQDPIGITELDLTLIAGSDPVPLAPGDSLNYYYQETRSNGLVNTASVDAQPTLPDGTPTGQANVNTDDTATYIHIYDPPFGQKTGTLNGDNLISWNMVWINDSPVTANNVVITDTPPVDTTYAGNLVCTAEGATVVTSCSFDPNDGPRGTVTAVATIAADAGATDQATANNELLISFDVTIDNTDQEQTIENQAQLTYDADNDGNVDFTVLSDDPSVLGASDPAAVSFTPTPTAEELSDTGRSTILYITAGMSLSLLAGIIVTRGPRAARRFR